MSDSQFEQRRDEYLSVFTRRRLLQSAVGLGALAAVSPVLAACGSSGGGSASSSAAASTAASTAGSASPSLGGALNFIGYPGEDAANVAKPFFEKNGITMNPSFIASPDEVLTKFKTGGKGEMDLIANNKDFQRNMVQSGTELYAPLDLSKIPNQAGLFPIFQKGDWVYKDGNTYGVPVIWGDEPCTFTSKWQGPPAKYTDFADPKWAGELCMVDDPVANTWLWAKSLGNADPSRLTQAQLDAAIEAMTKTKPNIVAFAKNLGDQADILVRGDASMAIGGWAYQIVLAKEKGVELKAASPSTDGTYYWSDAYGIAVDAPHPDNAYAFINFMVSPESNAAIATELGSAVTVVAAVDKLDPATRSLYDYKIVEDPTGGVLASQEVSPPAKAQGDIVGLPEWLKAWEAFKLA